MNILKTASTFSPVMMPLLVLALAAGCAKESTQDPATQAQENAEQSPNKNTNQIAPEAGPQLGQGNNENVVSAEEKISASTKRAKVRRDLVKNGIRVKTYSMRHGGSLPDSLDDLTTRSGLDPYGNAYVYNRIDDVDFEIWCLGADGKLGGEGFDADLSYQMAGNGVR